MDELKRYLRQNADQLDLDEPLPQVWERISAQTVVRKTPVLVIAMRWTAAACVLALAGVGVWHLAFNEKATPTSPVAVAKILEPVDQSPVTQPAKEDAAGVELAAADTKPQKQTTTAPHRQPQQSQARVENRAERQMLTEIETSFKQVINLQRARVSATPMFAETPAYFEDFTAQLKQMEKDEKVVKADIVRRGLNDALLEQLINLFQQKLNLLKQLQLEMNKTNNRYKQSRGPIDSTQTYFLNI